MLMAREGKTAKEMPPIVGAEFSASSMRLSPKKPKGLLSLAALSRGMTTQMPTMLLVDGYRFFIYSDEHKPPHVHVEKGEAVARYELSSEILLTKPSKGFNSGQLRVIRRLIEEKRLYFLERWREHFPSA